jgi:hydantoinase/carbamoylase family amidase
MDHRRDALLAAAEMILMVRDIAVSTGDGAVATVGSVQVSPGGANQIAEEVRLSVDFRHSDDTSLDHMEQQLREASGTVSNRHALELSTELWLSQSPVDFDSSVRAAIEQACDETGCRWIDLSSGAGHDAQVIAQETPTGMLFVPSRAGHSHRADEHTDIDDIVAGTEVLIRTLRQLAYGR